MLRVMKNIIKILVRRRSFIFVTFVLPVILIFSFSSIGNTMSSFKVDVYNQDSGEFGEIIEEKIRSIDGIEVKEVKSEDEYMNNLIFEECSVVVIIDENFTKSIIDGEENLIKVKSVSENEVKPIITSFINNEVSSLAMLCNNIDMEENGVEQVVNKFNDLKPEYTMISKSNNKPNLLNSLGMVAYIIFVSASMSCGFSLEDERLGTKDRVLLSKVTERKYYCAQLLLYFLLSSVPAVEYFIICKAFNYNIGFSSEYILLIVMLLLVLLAVSFALFISSIVKSKTFFSLVMTAFTVPVFMLSGAYWPFEIMSHKMQSIGNVLPIRWIYVIIEKLQSGGSVISVLSLIATLVMLVVVLLLLSIFCTSNKIVLVKDSK